MTIPKVPSGFGKAYPDALFHVINHDNFLDYSLQLAIANIAAGELLIHSQICFIRVMKE